MATFRVGLIGEYRSEVPAHRAIPSALALAAGTLNDCEVDTTWFATDLLVQDAAAQLEGLDGIWCVPGSPYASMVGAIQAIQFAREHRIPFLGTCGGFQYTLIEYARNVLGLVVAHGETHPDAPLLLVSRLACSLVEKQCDIQLLEGSRIREIYGKAQIRETYHCSFGLNPTQESAFADRPLRVSARDSEGEVRAVELEGHPFFFATLFQPERSALSGRVHPLIVAYLKAMR